MHESESNELVNCLICGTEISLALGRAYAVTDTTGMCFRCSLERGGMYDEERDAWSRSPDIAGLPATDI